MMKEQFTQGDWSVNEIAKTILVVTSDNGTNICEVECNYDVETHLIDASDEEMANAYLLKASKKMYEMLQELAQVARATGSKDEAEIINKLLAEARGEKSDTA